MNHPLPHIHIRPLLLWLAVALIGASSLGGIALNRSEPADPYGG